MDMLSQGNVDETLSSVLYLLCIIKMCFHLIW